MFYHLQYLCTAVLNYTTTVQRSNLPNVMTSWWSVFKWEMKRICCLLAASTTEFIATQNCFLFLEWVGRCRRKVETRLFPNLFSGSIIGIYFQCCSVSLKFKGEKWLYGVNLGILQKSSDQIKTLSYWWTTGSPWSCKSFHHPLQHGTSEMQKSVTSEIKPLIHLSPWHFLCSVGRFLIWIFSVTFASTTSVS